MPQPLVDCWIATSYIADIALEMLHINRVESNDGCIESNVGLSDGRTEVVWFSIFDEVFLDAIQGYEEWMDGLLVSILGAE